MSEQLNAAWQAFGISCQNFTEIVQQKVFPVVATTINRLFPHLEAQRRTQRFIHRHKREVDIIVRHSRSKT